MRDTDPIDLPSYHLFTQPTDPAVLADRSRAWNGTDFSFHDISTSSTRCSICP